MALLFQPYTVTVIESPPHNHEPNMVNFRYKSTSTKFYISLDPPISEEILYLQEGEYRYSIWTGRSISYNILFTELSVVTVATLGLILAYSKKKIES